MKCLAKRDSWQGKPKTDHQTKGKPNMKMIVVTEDSIGWEITNFYTRHKITFCPSLDTDEWGCKVNGQLQFWCSTHPSKLIQDCFDFLYGDINFLQFVHNCQMERD